MVSEQYSWPCHINTLPLLSQKALQWGMILRDSAVSLLRQLCTLYGVMLSVAGYVPRLSSMRRAVMAWFSGEPPSSLLLGGIRDTCA